MEGGARNVDIRGNATGCTIITGDNVAPLRLPLDSKLRENNEATRLVFGARRTTVVGRGPAQAHLSAFLDDSRPLSWWIVGGPGGAGKSRLALELCEQAKPNGWDAGFLDHGTLGFGWRDWTPEKDTLIVLDYASQSPEAIRKAIDEAQVSQPEGTPA